MIQRFKWFVASGLAIMMASACGAPVGESPPPPPAASEDVPARETPAPVGSVEAGFPEEISDDLLTEEETADLIEALEALEEGDLEPAAAAGSDGPEEMAGRAALRAPGLMIENEPYFLESVIGVYDEVTDQQILESQMVGMLSQADPNGEQEIEFIELGLSSSMKVSMTGSGFEILPTSPEQQYVASGSITRWTWAVTPQRTGRLPLIVTFATEVTGSDGKTYTQVLNTISRVIEVKSLDALFEPENVSARNVSEAIDEAQPEGAEASIPEQSETAASADLSVSSVDEVAFPAEDCIRPLESDSSGRLALIVVNQDYPVSVGALNNVYQDGATVRQALEEVGFEVDVCADLGRANFRRTMSNFNRKVAVAAETGVKPDVFFYYSGHGAALDGDLAGNYLIPADLEDLEPFQISADAIRLDAVMGGLTASGADTIFVVSDACRNVIEAKGGTKGFAPVGFRLRSQFMFGYATDWGDVALDNGHYARALAKAIREVDGPAELVFNQVQQEVAALTNDQQRPRYEDGLTRGYRFNPAP